MPVIASNFAASDAQVPSKKLSTHSKVRVTIEQMKASFVNGMNLTYRSCNYAQSCTTTHWVNKSLSIRKSLLCLDLVSVSVLGQLKLQAPLLAAPFPLCLYVSALRLYSPVEPKYVDLSSCHVGVE